MIPFFVFLLALERLFTQFLTHSIKILCTSKSGKNLEVYALRTLAAFSRKG